MTPTHAGSGARDHAAPPDFPPAPHEAALMIAISVVGLALLVTAFLLDPAGEGVGTHTQLGMNPCGFLERTGNPCPTCGMTTSFAHFADLEIVDAFRVQPFGAVLFILVAVATAVSLWHLARWRSPAAMLIRLPNRWLLLAVGLAMLLASWKWTMSRTGS